MKTIEQDHYSIVEMQKSQKVEHCFFVEHLLVLLAMIPEILTGRGFGGMHFGSDVGWGVLDGLKMRKYKQN